MVELLVIGLVVIVLVAVARLVWVISHRQEGPPVTEAQARENAAPLTTAVEGLTVARETDGDRELPVAESWRGARSWKLSAGIHKRGGTSPGFGRFEAAGAPMLMESGMR